MSRGQKVETVSLKKATMTKQHHNSIGRPPHDAPSNIHYGFVGKATFWASENLLFREAGRAQIATDNRDSFAGRRPQPHNTAWDVPPFYGDDPDDHWNIVWGIDLRNQDTGGTSGTIVRPTDSSYYIPW